MTDHAKRIEVARKLFAGWSSGDPDAPEPFMTPDAVLNDVASGRFEGWPAIRAFFAKGWPSGTTWCWRPTSSG